VKKLHLGILITPLDPGELRDYGMRLELLEFKPHVFHKVPTYYFRMLEINSNSEAGNINLRLGWNKNLTHYGGHIGYGVHEAYRGQRYAARAVILLKSLAYRHGFQELWITCNPENSASRRSCELAGAEFVETVDVPKSSAYYAREIRQKCRYRLTLAE
jgi:predicted acetyltransferase